MAFNHIHVSADGKGELWLPDSSEMVVMAQNAANMYLFYCVTVLTGICSDCAKTSRFA